MCLSRRERGNRTGDYEQRTAGAGCCKACFTLRNRSALAGASENLSWRMIILASATPHARLSGGWWYAWVGATTPGVWTLWMRESHAVITHQLASDASELGGDTSPPGHFLPLGSLLILVGIWTGALRHGVEAANGI